MFDSGQINLDITFFIKRTLLTQCSFKVTDSSSFSCEKKNWNSQKFDEKANEHNFF